MATRKRAAAKKTVAAPESTAANAPANAPRSTAKSTSGTAQKPLATGDVDQFPPHVFRADMGEGIPPQKDALNPDRAK